jgi:hypothetical protein
MHLGAGFKKVIFGENTLWTFHLSIYVLWISRMLPNYFFDDSVLSISLLHLSTVFISLILESFSFFTFFHIFVFQGGSSTKFLSSSFKFFLF